MSKQTVTLTAVPVIPGGGTASSFRWWALAIVAAAQFMFVVDAFIVNVALPSIRAGLNASIGEMQSVVALYQIAFAILVVSGGRLGDIYGSKIIFLIGLLGFTAASLWCGLARSGSELVLARAGQGASAAFMIPQVLATIHTLFAGAERGKAFGIFGFTLGFGGAFGFALGGWLATANIGGFGWRAVFFVNGPIGLALAIGAVMVLPRSLRKSAVRLDFAGAILLLISLLCIIGPMLTGADMGWPYWLALPAAFGIAMLIVFWRSQGWVENRGGLPLIHQSLIRDRHFANGLGTVFLLGFANLSFYLLITLYMQNQLHFTPLRSGATVVPLAIVFAIVSRGAGPRAQRRGVQALAEGCYVAIAALVALIALTANIAGPPLLGLAIVLMVFGAGQAMVMAPLFALVLSKVPPFHAGSGAGVLSTVQQIGNASGVAVTGAIYFGVGQAHERVLAFALCLALLAAAFAALAALIRELGTRAIAVDYPQKEMHLRSTDARHK